MSNQQESEDPAPKTDPQLDANDEQAVNRSGKLTAEQLAKLSGPGMKPGEGKKRIELPKGFQHKGGSGMFQSPKFTQQAPRQKQAKSSRASGRRGS